MNLTLDKKNYTILCVVVLVIASCLRFYNLDGSDLSHDEATWVNFSFAPFSEFLNETRNGNTSPIFLPFVYFVLGESIRDPFLIRVLPTIFSLGAILVFLLMPRIEVDRRVCLLAAFMCAISPAQVQLAQQAREYSLGVFGGSMCLYAFFAYINQRMILPLILVAFIVPFLSYGTIFLIPALGMILVLLSLKKGDFDHKLSTAAVTFFLGCLISYSITARFQFARSYSHSAAWYLEPYYPPKYDGVSGVINWLVESIYYTFTYNLGNHYSYFANQYTILILLIVTSFFVWFCFLRFLEKEPRNLRTDHLAFSALLLLLSIQIISSLMLIYPFGGTHQTIFMAPLIYFCVAVMLTDLISSERSTKLTTFISIAFVAVFSVHNAFSMPIAYREYNPAKLLVEHVSAEDMKDVYVHERATHTIIFHVPDFPGVFGRNKTNGAKIVEEIVSFNDSINRSCRKWVLFGTEIYNLSGKIISEIVDRGFPEPRIFRDKGSALYEFDNC